MVKFNLDEIGGTECNDKRFLEAEIEKWLYSPVRKSQILGEEYYLGVQDIRHKERTAIGGSGRLFSLSNVPNNRITNNQFAKVVDQKANYLCGKPFVINGENDAYIEALKGILDDEFQVKMYNICKWALEGGIAWLYCYIKSGVPQFKVIPAYEVLPFWADSEHGTLDAVVRLYPKSVYDCDFNEDVIYKAEIFHAGGIDEYDYVNGHLINRVKVGEAEGDLPIIPFKLNGSELPLIRRVKCLQDALNKITSNLMDSMEEDVRNTILVLRNYDGEDLGEFRHNLATYGAVKVRDYEGGSGGVEALKLDINADNYIAVADMLKRAITENAKGFDAKDKRLGGNPNMLNIRSVYSDIDLDANVTEAQFRCSLKKLLKFINEYLLACGKGDYTEEKAEIIFNRDVLINESEVIEDISRSEYLSLRTKIAQHPWVNDVEMEIRRIEAEKKANT